VSDPPSHRRNIDVLILPSLSRPGRVLSVSWPELFFLLFSQPQLSRPHTARVTHPPHTHTHTPHHTRPRGSSPAPTPGDCESLLPPLLRRARTLPPTPPSDQSLPPPPQPTHLILSPFPPHRISSSNAKPTVGSSARRTSTTSKRLPAGGAAPGRTRGSTAARPRA
jgi:hypothetical protein